MTLLFLPLGALAKEPAGAAADKPAPAKSAADSAAPEPVTPKSLSEQVEKGLAYLLSQQHEDGGWGQGGGWRQAIQASSPNAPSSQEKPSSTARPAVAVGGRVEGKEVADPSDVGNTCIAAMALLRAGSSPSEGPHAKQLARAVDFICRKVEASDTESLYVTDVRDTQLQSKIGAYADTFLAGWLLAEVKGKTKDGADSRMLAALDKVIAKIERNQKADGAFANNHGWAAVHSQALCGICLNSAAANGVKVKAETLARDYRLATNNLDVEKGEFKKAEGDRRGSFSGFAGAASAAAPSAPSNAGIDLYQLSAQNAQLQSKTSANRAPKQAAERVLAAPESNSEQRADAAAKLADINAEDKAQAAATKGIVDKLDDQRFVAGFGNNGGEEFLSYMNISAALLVKGGPEWKKWDERMASNLNHAQNGDGSWSGSHCITGRTFCTATALLTLTADRAPAATPAEKNSASPASVKPAAVR
jgi:hypothetical protein